jgi:hypothetical protein
MSRDNPTGRLATMACAVSLVATVVATSGCWLEGRAVYAGPVYEDYPPDAYIATTEPVYYEGHASYWYGGRWYYRDGGRWGRYDREPRVLYDRRREAPPGRRTYERSEGRPGGRSGGRHEERSGGHR